MLIGEYTHTIDDKNRMSLPAKFRAELGKKVVITPGLEDCLFVFNMKEWLKVKAKLSNSESDLSFLSADRRSFNRFMFGRAAEVEVDSIGRILLPTFLKERIGLKGSAMVVGVEDRVEIWHEKAWDKYKNEIEKKAGDLAEKLAGNK
ncbi:MAG TPA: division/cell wall cluster transcriptional repressor MraZ [Candidatus Paceibacterota bacterium]